LGREGRRAGGEAKRAGGRKEREKVRRKRRKGWAGGVFWAARRRIGPSKRERVELGWAKRIREREGEKGVVFGTFELMFLFQTTQQQAKPMQRDEYIKHFVNSKFNIV
jgi:hypothetical protein